MKLSRSTKDVVVVAVPSVLVGALVGALLRSFTPVVVKYEIGVGEILNATVIVLLGLLVADYLTRRATDLRFEKDQLMQDCADVLRAIGEARDFAGKTRRIQGTADERREILSLLGTTFTALETLERDVSLCQGTIGVIEIASVKDGLLRYKATLTGGPFPQNPLDDDTYLDSERRYVECTNALAKLRFELNRR